MLVVYIIPTVFFDYLTNYYYCFSYNNIKGNIIYWTYTMRGDTRSNREQQDSSSGSSSPHSNTSRDDEILEVSPPGFMPKPIYNFSIPDVIKHEPRVERHDNSERLDCDITNTNSSLRKRSCPTRMAQENLTQENDIPVSVRRKKRRRIEAAENLIDEDDDDCHRPPVIDLTDSHDEYTNALSDSEVNDSSHIETRLVSLLGLVSSHYESSQSVRPSVRPSFRLSVRLSF